MTKIKTYSLNILAFVPMSVFIVSSVFLAQTQGMFLENIFWLMTGFMALQCNADRVINISQGIARFYISAITANVILLTCPLLDIEPALWIKVLFISVLAIAFGLSMVNHHKNVKQIKTPNHLGD